MEGRPMENKESEVLLEIVNLLELVTMSSGGLEKDFYAK
jgi:hypothetical protein